MDFNSYQKFAKKTDFHSPKKEKKVFGNLFAYPTFGITGEAGEFADKIKKLYRDHEGKLSPEMKHDLVLELGDILWYIAKMARALGVSLDDVARLNLKKIASRKKRGMIHGNGDHR